MRSQRHSPILAILCLLSCLAAACANRVGAWHCGDGILDQEEQCDDGPQNLGLYGGCTAECLRAPYCGDGVVQQENGEECDLGATLNDGTNCMQDCTLPKNAPYCGDGVVQHENGEECDLGAERNDGTTCMQDCTLPKNAPYCGDGFVQHENGEECDLGAERNDGTTCMQDCTLPKNAPYCGDGVVQHENGEECDLGAERNDGTNCMKDCTLPKNAPYCGDAVVQQENGEECDLGAERNDGAYGGCNKDCSRAPYCGDAVVQQENGEECDLGAERNDGAYGGCNKDCSRAPYCGDGVVQLDFEACEPGSDHTPCTSECTLDTSKLGIVIQNLSSPLETSEDGTKQVTFDLVLTAKPRRPVYIQIFSSDETEGAVSPKLIIFTADDYNVSQTVTVSGVDDDLEDGDVPFEIAFEVTSSDTNYNDYELPSLQVTNLNDDIPPSGAYVDIRIMSANLTTGNYQNYDNGDGIRIMKSVSPDIILVQEFNYTDGQRAMTNLVCGETCDYFSGATYENGNTIPNGVISKYPILSTGSAQSPKYENRAWDWAIIDIPGDKELLVFSLHLHSKQEKAENYEMDLVEDFIQDKAAEGDYYLAFGGDFNISNRSTAEEAFKDIAVVDPSNFPVDQDGNDNTNNARKKPYDWILFSKDLHRREIPILLGTRSYPHGHVIDARVYEKHNELSLLPDVKADDSNASQHMAVIRDVRIYTESSP